MSEIGERLWEDCLEFSKRDLGEHDVAYLFVDGIAARIRPGQRREPVLAAWGITGQGRKVLLGLMAGSKEDHETVSAFFQDMRNRNLGEPLLVVSDDGAAGIIKATETCFPRSERQRCLAHRMRNLACKVPEDRWPEFKVRAQAAYQAPSRAIARDLAGTLETEFGRSLPSAVACFLDDFEALHRPSADAGEPPACDPDHQSPGTAVRRGAPAHEDHSQRLGREGGPEADVRCDDQGVGTLALCAGHALRKTADGGVEKRARRGISGADRTRPGRSSRGTHLEIIQQKTDLTIVDVYQVRER